MAGNDRNRVRHEPATHRFMERLVEKRREGPPLKALMLLDDLIVIGATEMEMIVEVTI